MRSRFEQRGQGGGIEVDPGNEINDRRAGLDRRSLGKAGRGDQPRHRLDRQIHGQIIAVGPGQAVTRPRGINKTRVDPVQHLPADAEPVHNPGCEILKQHVAAFDHAEQQRAAAFVLQVQGDRALVGVQHRDRKGRALARRRPATERLALRRLDLDHVGPGLGHQQGCVGTLINLAEVKYDNTGQRPVDLDRHQRAFCGCTIEAACGCGDAGVNAPGPQALLMLPRRSHIVAVMGDGYNYLDPDQPGALLLSVDAQPLGEAALPASVPQRPPHDKEPK